MVDNPIIRKSFASETEKALSEFIQPLKLAISNQTAGRHEIPAGSILSASALADPTSAIGPDNWSRIDVKNIEWITFFGEIGSLLIVADEPSAWPYGATPPWWKNTVLLPGQYMRVKRETVYVFMLPAAVAFNTILSLTTVPFAVSPEKRYVMLSHNAESPILVQPPAFAMVAQSLETPAHHFYLNIWIFNWYQQLARARFKFGFDADGSAVNDIFIEETNLDIQNSGLAPLTFDPNELAFVSPAVVSGGVVGRYDLKFDDGDCGLMVGTKALQDKVDAAWNIQLTLTGWCKNNG